MDRAAVEEWVRRYEELWRTPGTDRLDELFAPGATYLTSPWAEPVPDLAAFWEAERVSADEGFSTSSEVVAVDGTTAVVRVAVDYDTGKRWRDLWLVTLDDEGRCTAFEEWPFAPSQPDEH
jgi:hypothetical protein